MKRGEKKKRSEVGIWRIFEGWSGWICVYKPLTIVRSSIWFYTNIVETFFVVRSSARASHRSNAFQKFSTAKKWGQSTWSRLIRKKNLRFWMRSFFLHFVCKCVNWFEIRMNFWGLYFQPTDEWGPLRRCCQ